jgi:serine phosphatase RsbU (regulator of sigma subunit)
MDESLISRVSLFAGLPPEEIHTLAQTLQLKQVPAGTIIIHEGGRDDRFYILLDGEVEVFKAMAGPTTPDDPTMPEGSSQLHGEERILGRLDQGALIGEMSLFSRDGRHTASVRALSPLRLLEMTRGEFDALLQRQPAMTYDMVRLLSRRLERSENVTILDLQEKNLQLTKAYLELKAAQALLVEKEKLEHELELARDIQLSILPEPIPSLAGFDFGALMVPARVVGGDFYDFIPLDDERMGIVVGDVSDKSMPAAMYMSLSYSLIRAEARRSDSAAETLQNVNRHLLDISSSGMFVTVLYGILNRVSREFRFARAGHEYPIIMDRGGQPLQLARTSGRLMGLFDELDLQEQSIVFPAGGAALIFSDGITEAMDGQGRQFGSRRATDFLGRQLAGLTTHGLAQRISEQLLQEVQAFTSPALQHDDITIVAICGLE